MNKLSEANAPIEKENPNGGSRFPQVEKIETTPITQMEKVPLRYYKDLLLSSIRAIVAFVIASVGIAFLITKLTPPTYLTATTIMISRANLQQSSNYDTVMISENLARTYAEMLVSKQVLDQLAMSLGTGLSAGDLRDAIFANHVMDTQLIQISVEHSDPELAVKIANGLVQVFSSQLEKDQFNSATHQDGEIKVQLQENEDEINRLLGKIQDQSVQLHQQRMDDIKTSITDLQDQIDKLDQEIVPLLALPRLTASEQFNLTSKQTHKGELSELLSQYHRELVTLTISGPTFDAQDFVSSQDYALLDQYQRTKLGLMQTQQNIQIARIQNRVMVTQVDQPVLPEIPRRPNMVVNLALGGIAGLLLSLIYIFTVKLGRR